MYKRVDGSNGDEELRGFSYLNVYGEEEFVNLNLHDDTVTLKIDDEHVGVFDIDIPKLIKALQAAYDYKVLKVA